MSTKKLTAPLPENGTTFVKKERGEILNIDKNSYYMRVAIKNREEGIRKDKEAMQIQINELKDLVNSLLEQNKKII